MSTTPPARSKTVYSPVRTGDADVGGGEPGLVQPFSPAADQATAKRRCSLLLLVLLPLLGAAVAASLCVLLDAPRLLSLSRRGPPSPPPPPPAAAAASRSSSPWPWSSSASAYRQFHPTWQRLVPTVGELRALRAAHRHSLNATGECGVLKGLEHGGWGVSDAFELRWNPSHCRLRRPSQAQALQCLAGQSLYFVGDSLTRYQYMSLTSFLSSPDGAWPEPLGSMPDAPNPTLEREWPSWPAYYNASSSLSGGRETCACERTGGLHWRQWVERRHFYDPDAQLTVRALQAPTMESVLAALHDVAEEQAAAGAGTGRSAYDYTAHADPQPCANSSHSSCAYRADVPFQPSTALIVNTGLWQVAENAQANGIPVAYSPGDARFYSALPAFFAQQQQQQHGQPAGGAPRLIWKLTTARQAVGEAEPGSYAAQMSAFANGTGQWDMLDVFSMTNNHTAVSHAYWDPNHFLPFVYEEMNAFLLNMLCTPDWTFVPQRQQQQQQQSASEAAR